MLEEWLCTAHAAACASCEVTDYAQDEPTHLEGAPNQEKISILSTSIFKYLFVYTYTHISPAVLVCTLFELQIRTPLRIRCKMQEPAANDSAAHHLAQGDHREEAAKRDRQDIENQRP